MKYYVIDSATNNAEYCVLEEYTNKKDAIERAKIRVKTEVCDCFEVYKVDEQTEIKTKRDLIDWLNDDGRDSFDYLVDGFYRD